MRRHLIVTRLEELAGTGRTGTLQVWGDGGGVIYLRDGQVVFADSGRTVGPEVASGLEALTPAERHRVVREATLDSLLDLVSGRPHYSRFRASEHPDSPGLAGTADLPALPVPALIAEVSRRREIVDQMAPVLTADTALTRNPLLRSRAVRVTNWQWSLLIRLGDQSTARTLALSLGRGVFATTVEAHRLAALGLIRPGEDAFLSPEPPPPAGLRPAGQRRYERAAISFTRAVR